MDGTKHHVGTSDPICSSLQSVTRSAVQSLFPLAFRAGSIPFFRVQDAAISWRQLVCFLAGEVFTAVAELFSKESVSGHSAIHFVINCFRTLLASFLLHVYALGSICFKNDTKRLWHLRPWCCEVPSARSGCSNRALWPLGIAVHEILLSMDFVVGWHDLWMSTPCREVR